MKSTHHAKMFELVIKKTTSEDHLDVLAPVCSDDGSSPFESRRYVDRPIAESHLLRMAIANPVKLKRVNFDSHRSATDNELSLLTHYLEIIALSLVAAERT